MKKKLNSQDSQSMLIAVLVITSALTNLLVSNLLSWAWRSYLASLPPLSLHLVTYLHNALFQTYNILVSAVCLGILLKYSLGVLPPPLALLLYPLSVLSVMGVEGLLIAIAVVRLLFVTSPAWISQQEDQLLCRKILLIVFIVSLALTVAAGFFIFQSKTPATPNTHRMNILVAAIFLLANASVFASYLICSIISRRRQQASLSILIGERNAQNDQLSRVRKMLLGNCLALICSGSMLAVTILHSPYEQLSYRPLEIQAHVLIMVYHAYQVSGFRAFVARKAVQRWQSLILYWSGKYRQVAPLSNIAGERSNADIATLSKSAMGSQPLFVVGSPMPRSSDQIADIDADFSASEDGGVAEGHRPMTAGALANRPAVMRIQVREADQSFLDEEKIRHFRN
jgi:hypothetical protein